MQQVLSVQQVPGLPGLQVLRVPLEQVKPDLRVQQVRQVPRVPYAIPEQGLPVLQVQQGPQVLE